MSLTRQVLLFALVLSLLGTSGCGGWRLRGSVEIDTQVTELAIQSGRVSRDLVEELERQTSATGIAVVPASEAPLTIRLIDDNNERRNYTIGASNQAAEFILIYTARFEIRDQEQTVVVPETELRQERIYLNDVNNPHAKANEERLLSKELRSKIATQILRQALSFAAESRLSHASSP